jgi:hypothetical protein
MMDGKPHDEPVIQMCDVFVDKGGLVFTTDHHAGLCVMEYGG